jgi:hypothetical protein
MPRHLTCSFCHCFNPIGATHFVECQHRCDVPRQACDCKVCSRPYVPPPVTEADLGVRGGNCHARGKASPGLARQRTAGHYQPEPVMPWLCEARRGGAAPGFLWLDKVWCGEARRCTALQLRVGCRKARRRRVLPGKSRFGKVGWRGAFPGAAGRCAATEEDRARHNAARCWVSAVNGWGGMGRWAFHVCRDSHTLEAELLRLHG